MSSTRTGCKRAGADVQGDEGMPHLPRLERGKNCGVEVQSGRRRRDSARDARIYGLIAFAVRRSARAADIGRQRNLAVRSKNSSTSQENSRRNNSPSLPSMRALWPAASRIAAPTSRPLLARTWASAVVAVNARSRRISTRPPLSLVPKSRAGITRVSLNTRRSSGSSSDGKSRNAVAVGS